jgi:hypothetical protein
MSVTKKIAVYLMLLVFLTGSIGVAINKHICYSEGIVEFYFASNNIACSEHSDANIAETSCCKKPLDSKEQKPDCCNDDVIYAVLDIDQLQSETNTFALSLPSVEIPFTLHHLCDCLLQYFNSAINIKAPPLLHNVSSITFLSFIAVFRI